MGVRVFFPREWTVRVNPVAGCGRFRGGHLREYLLFSSFPTTLHEPTLPKEKEDVRLSTACSFLSWSNWPSVEAFPAHCSQDRQNPPAPDTACPTAVNSNWWPSNLWEVAPLAGFKSLKEVMMSASISIYKTPVRTNKRMKQLESLPANVWQPLAGASWRTEQGCPSPLSPTPPATRGSHGGWERSVVGGYILFYCVEFFFKSCFMKFKNF